MNLNKIYAIIGGLIGIVLGLVLSFFVLALEIAGAFATHKGAEVLYVMIIVTVPLLALVVSVRLGAKFGRKVESKSVQYGEHSLSRAKHFAYTLLTVISICVILFFAYVALQSYRLYYGV